MTDDDCPSSSRESAKISLSNRIVISTVTLVAFNMQWWLFELLRAPYRPPEDMTTFLGGSERAAVIALMIAGGIAWLAYVVWFSWQFMLSWIDVMAFAVMCSFLSVAALLIIVYPVWPVTPFELFWS